MVRVRLPSGEKKLSGTIPDVMASRSSLQDSVDSVRGPGNHKLRYPEGPAIEKSNPDLFKSVFFGSKSYVRGYF